MNLALKNTLIIIVVAAVAGLVLYAIPKNKKPAQQSRDLSAITDFSSCAEAGFPLEESYPMVCRTPDGRSFTEDLTDSADVVVEAPTVGQVVASPLAVTGKARGNWFFEANLPVTLKDMNGKVLAQKGAQAQGDWMTTDYVNFSVSLEFAAPETEYGVLLIEKDNPSGLPENDAAYAIPVRFK